MNRTKMLLRILLPLGIVALAALAAKAIVDSREAPQPTPPAASIPLVRTVALAPAPVQLGVHAQGTVLPRTETVLKAEVAARVTRIAPSLASGGFFDADEVLLIGLDELFAEDVI